MFIVHYEGVGEGCDYTIGCNECTIKLPNSLKTMQEAVDYIRSDEEFSLDYFGKSRIEKATVYEIQSCQVIDVKDIIQKEKLEREKQKVIQKEKNELAEFERLKEKFGK